MADQTKLDQTSLARAETSERVQEAEFEPIRVALVQSHDLKSVFDLVLAAQAAVQARKEAKEKLRPAAEKLAMGTTLWMLFATIGYLIYGSTGGSISILLASGAFTMATTKMPDLIDNPLLGDAETVSDFFLHWLFNSLFPLTGSIALGNLLVKAYTDTLLPKNASRPEDRRWASQILNDDRAGYLLEAAAKVSGWNADVHYVNREIKVYNAGLLNEKDLNRELIEKVRERRERILKHLTLAQSLLNEGPIGSVVKQIESGRDPLHRLTDEMSEMDDRLAELRPAPTEETAAILEVSKTGKKRN